MAQSEKHARDLEDRLGARRYMAVDWSGIPGQASREFFAQRNTFLEMLQAEPRLHRPLVVNKIRPAGKSIFAGISKKDMNEVVEELARPGKFIEIKDPMMDLVERVGRLDWQLDKSFFRDPLLLLC